MEQDEEDFLSTKNIWILVGILVIGSMMYQYLAVRKSLQDTLERIEVVNTDLRLVKDSLLQTQQSLHLLLQHADQRSEDLKMIRQHIGILGKDNAETPWIGEASSSKPINKANTDKPLDQLLSIQEGNQ